MSASGDADGALNFQPIFKDIRKTATLDKLSHKLNRIKGVLYRWQQVCQLPIV